VVKVANDFMDFENRCGTHLMNRLLGVDGAAAASLWSTESGADSSESGAISSEVLG
jgi:hypothetical protein